MSQQHKNDIADIKVSYPLEKVFTADSCEDMIVVWDFK